MGSLKSTELAQVVANDIAAFRDQPEEYFELQLEYYENGKTIPQPPLFIREVRASSALNNGTEMVHCKTESGRHVEILLPPPAERGEGFAEVKVEGE